MKKILSILALAAAGCLSVRAQMDSPGVTPGLSDAMTKVFGTNLNFSAQMQTEVKMSPQNQTIGMSGKMYFSHGDSRSEMDMTQMTGSSIPPEAIAQMKAMGMDKMISISQNATKTLYVIYPGLQAYAKMQTPNANSATNDVKVSETDLGKETLDGHPCVKKSYTFTTPNNQNIHVITWNATDLKNVPVQVQTVMPSSNGTNSSTMHLTQINLDKPDAALFTPPTGYTAYSDIQTMMQTEMMKKMGGGAGMPGGQ